MCALPRVFGEASPLTFGLFCVIIIKKGDNMDDEKPMYEYNIKKESWYKDYRRSKKNEIDYLGLAILILGLVALAGITYLLK